MLDRRGVDWRHGFAMFHETEGPRVFHDAMVILVNPEAFASVLRGEPSVPASSTLSVRRI